MSNEVQGMDWGLVGSVLFDVDVPDGVADFDFSFGV